MTTTQQDQQPQQETAPMFRINFRQPSRYHRSGHSPIVRQGLRTYTSRAEADAQVAIFRKVFPNTLHYVEPA